MPVGGLDLAFLGEGGSQISLNQQQQQSQQSQSQPQWQGSAMALSAETDTAAETSIGPGEVIATQQTELDSLRQQRSSNR